jgi:hypothetical protein
MLGRKAFAAAPFGQTAVCLERGRNGTHPRAQIDRLGGERAVDDAELPAAERLIDHGGHVRRELPVAPERKLVDQAQDTDKLLVVVREAPLARHIA